MPRREIAHVLRIRKKTVSTYRARILLELKARSVVDLIHYAAEEGFVVGWGQPRSRDGAGFGASEQHQVPVQ
jgi:hypothetical protein